MFHYITNVEQNNAYTLNTKMNPVYVSLSKKDTKSCIFLDNESCIQLTNSINKGLTSKIIRGLRLNENDRIKFNIDNEINCSINIKNNSSPLQIIDAKIYKFSIRFDGRKLVISVKIKYFIDKILKFKCDNTKKVCKSEIKIKNICVTGNITDEIEKKLFEESNKYRCKSYKTRIYSRTEIYSTGRTIHAVTIRWLIFSK